MLGNYYFYFQTECSLLFFFFSKHLTRRSMSILVENGSGWVICHEKAVEDIYKNVKIGSQDLKENLRYKADLFNISVPFYYKMENSYMPPDCVSTEEPSSAKLAVNCRMDGSSAEVTPYCVLDSEVKPHCDLASETDKNIVTATQVDPNFASSSQSNDAQNALTTNTKRKVSSNILFFVFNQLRYKRL